MRCVANFVRLIAVVSNLSLQQQEDTIKSDLAVDINRDVCLLKKISPSLQLPAKAVELVSLMRSECAQQELSRAKALIDKWNAAGDRKKLREADDRHAAISKMLSQGKLETLSATAFTKVVSTALFHYLAVTLAICLTDRLPN